MLPTLGNCGKCEKVVKAGIKCVKCDKWFHRKCEKVPAGEGSNDYVCKTCKPATVQEVSSDDDSDNDSVDHMFSDLECDNCVCTGKLLEEEKSKTKSLEKINNILQNDIVELKAEIQQLKEKLEKSEWIEVDRQKRRERRWSHNDIGVTASNGHVKETVNKFNLLSDLDFPKIKQQTKPSKSNDKVKSTTKNNVNKPRKKKVLLLSASQGRHCSALLQKNLGNDFEVCGIVKPSAKLKDVVRDAHQKVKDFNENDCLIVLGGTNDVEADGMYKQSISKDLRKVLPLSKQTNVIFNSIPTRFDRPDLKKHVDIANKIIHFTINDSSNKKSSNLRLNFNNERLSRDCYTRHGLHLNLKGKQEMCKKLSTFVLDCVNKKTFLDKSQVRAGTVKS